MVDARAEGHLGRLEGILGGEVDVQEEDSSLVHRPRRAQNGGHPLIDVVALGAGAETQITGKTILNPVDSQGTVGPMALELSGNTLSS